MAKSFTGECFFVYLNADGPFNDTITALRNLTAGTGASEAGALKPLDRAEGEVGESYDIPIDTCYYSSRMILRVFANVNELDFWVERLKNEHGKAYKDAILSKVCSLIVHIRADFTQNDFENLKRLFAEIPNDGQVLLVDGDCERYKQKLECLQRFCSIYLIELIELQPSEETTKMLEDFGESIGLMRLNEILQCLNWPNSKYKSNNASLISNNAILHSDNPKTEFACALSTLPPSQQASDVEMLEEKTSLLVDMLCAFIMPKDAKKDVLEVFGDLLNEDEIFEQPAEQLRKRDDKESIATFTLPAGGHDNETNLSKVNDFSSFDCELENLSLGDGWKYGSQINAQLDVLALKHGEWYNEEPEKPKDAAGAAHVVHNFVEVLCNNLVKTTENGEEKEMQPSYDTNSSTVDDVQSSAISNVCKSLLNSTALKEDMPFTDVLTLVLQEKEKQKAAGLASKPFFSSSILDNKKMKVEKGRDNQISAEKTPISDSALVISALMGHLNELKNDGMSLDRRERVSLAENVSVSVLKNFDSIYDKDDAEESFAEPYDLQETSIKPSDSPIDLKKVADEQKTDSHSLDASENINTPTEQTKAVEFEQTNPKMDNVLVRPRLLSKEKID